MIEHSEQFTELAKALCAAQGEMTIAVKDRKNDHFKASYATLDAVIDAVRGPLTKNGLSFIQAPGKIGEDGALPVMTMLMHSSGQFMRSTLYVPVVNKTPQGVGSAMTYARRYSLMSILGIAAGDDDDAEAAMGRGAAGTNGTKPKSSAAAKRDGDWQRLTGEIDKCATLADAWQWHDLRQEDISALSQNWRDQIAEYFGKKVDALALAHLEEAKARLKKGLNADAVEKIAKTPDFKKFVGDLPDRQKEELGAFYRELLADLTTAQMAA